MCVFFFSNMQAVSFEISNFSHVKHIKLKDTSRYTDKDEILKNVSSLYI